MQIEEGGKKKRTGVQIFTLSQRQEKNQWESFNSENAGP